VLKFALLGSDLHTYDTFTKTLFLPEPEIHTHFYIVYIYAAQH